MYHVEHIGVAVKNISKSVEFYTTVLKCKIEDRFENERARFAFLKAGQQTLELIEYREDSEKARGAGIVDHIAFAVSDIDAETARLRQHNVTLLFEKPQVMKSGKKILFFAGPDGERLEFVQK